MKIPWQRYSLIKSSVSLTYLYLIGFGTTITASLTVFLAAALAAASVFASFTAAFLFKLDESPATDVGTFASSEAFLSFAF